MLADDENALADQVTTRTHIHTHTNTHARIHTHIRWYTEVFTELCIDTSFVCLSGVWADRTGYFDHQTVERDQRHVGQVNSTPVCVLLMCTCTCRCVCFMILTCVFLYVFVTSVQTSPRSSTPVWTEVFLVSWTTWPSFSGHLPATPPRALRLIGQFLCRQKCSFFYLGFTMFFFFVCVVVHKKH